MEKTVFMQLSPQLNPWGLGREKDRGKKNLIFPSPIKSSYRRVGLLPGLDSGIHFNVFLQPLRTRGIIIIKNNIPKDVVLSVWVGSLTIHKLLTS